MTSLAPLGESPHAMTLGEKQRIFPPLLAHLIQHIYSRGYQVTMGEAWRPPEMALIYARTQKGTLNSLHISKLAVDLNLFKDGKYLDKSEDHKEFGAYWESLHPLCSWGGRFDDGNHYSLTHEGRR